MISVNFFAKILKPHLPRLGMSENSAYQLQT